MVVLQCKLLSSWGSRTSAVAYLGGAWCDGPPLAQPWKFFTGDFIWKGAFFAVFQQISGKNGRICGFHWTFKSKKCFSFMGASPPWPPTRGSAPGSRWGLCPQTSIIGSRSARSPWPPLCQILNTPLDISLHCLMDFMIRVDYICVFINT